MKATQKNPIKIALSHLLCKQVYGGLGLRKGDSIKPLHQKS